MEWYNNFDQVVTFAIILNDAMIFETPTDAIDYFEKPWNWTNEFNLWQSLKEPTIESDNWEEFVTQLYQRLKEV